MAELGHPSRTEGHLSAACLLENIAQLGHLPLPTRRARATSTRSRTGRWCGRASTIRWAGPRRELPAAYAGAERLDAGGRLVIPGLVDCHTHLAFGGWRAEEFEQRILGRSYLEIAAAGGGIARTMRLTREAAEAELAARAAGFLREMLALGVTTVECKSGYGLDREHELRLLRVYRALAARAAGPAGPDVSGRARRAARVPGRPRGLPPPPDRRAASRHRARAAGGVLRRLRRALGVHGRGGAATAPRGPGGRARAPSSTRTS